MTKFYLYMCRRMLHTGTWVKSHHNSRGIAGATDLFNTHTHTPWDMLWSTDTGAAVVYRSTSLTYYISHYHRERAGPFLARHMAAESSGRMGDYFRMALAWTTSVYIWVRSATGGSHVEIYGAEEGSEGLGVFT